MAITRLGNNSVTKANIPVGNEFLNGIGGDTFFYTNPSNQYKYKIHRFYQTGTFTIEYGSGEIEYLCIAAGGSARWGQWQGGGGAGGTLTGTFIGQPGNYSITVGNAVLGPTQGQNSSVYGTNASILSYGGGYGGGRYGGAGTSGGSGGGGGGYNNSPGSGVAGQGNSGGSGSGTSAGGGGGKGSAGSGSTRGAGVSYSITGSAVTYASGANGFNIGGNSMKLIGFGDGGGGGNESWWYRSGSGVIILRYRIA